jgi:hypothetical protein
MNDLTDRVNKLAQESSQTLLDTAYFVGRQNGALLQTWFNTLEANHQTSRDLLGKSINQMFEAQQLWYKLSTEWFRSSTETWTNATNGATEQFQAATKTAANGTRSAQTVGK